MTEQQDDRAYWAELEESVRQGKERVRNFIDANRATILEMGTINPDYIITHWYALVSCLGYGVAWWIQGLLVTQTIQFPAEVVESRLEKYQSLLESAAELKATTFDWNLKELYGKWNNSIFLALVHLPSDRN